MKASSKQWRKTKTTKPKWFQGSAVNEVKQKTGKRSKTRLQIQQLCDYAKNFKSYFSKVDADDDVGIGVEMCNVVRILVAHAHCYEDS